MKYAARLGSLLTLILLASACSSTRHHQIWHTERLHEEFSAGDADEVQTFADYQALEDRLFDELQEEILAKTETGPAFNLNRFSAGSAADPTGFEPNWNRSYELDVDNPAGGVLLIHGMSDSPYSLRALGQALHRQGYHVLGMRMPGHGTAPSGMRFVDPEDMVAAVELGMRHLSERVGDQALYIVGYSTGAPLALNYSLDAYDNPELAVPKSIILVSPAIRISPVAGAASFKRSLSVLPGLGGYAYLSINPEFDPYKYNSFATNAADVVHKLTRRVDRRIAARAKKNPAAVLPPVLAFKSTVDATVTTNAIVNNLLGRLVGGGHELVLFDINRDEALGTELLINDPAPLTDAVLNSSGLPFRLTLISNADPSSREVVSRSKPAFSGELSDPEPLGLSWPAGVISLSHVALPFPPDDPVYGQRPPDNDDLLFLGQMNLQGERGLLTISTVWQFRLRYNPFYEYLERRSLEWVGAK